MTAGTDRLEVLDATECLRLLTEHRLKIGRVAFVADGFPVVLPVNYRMDAGTIVFRTGLGGKLDAAVTGSPLAFEVDDVDEHWQEGWSVLVQGRAAEIVAPGEVVRVRQLGLRPWAEGERHRYIRLRPGGISGRRIL